MGRDHLGGFEHRVLLAILRLGDRAYSVSIVQELEERLGRTVAPAAVYIALRRLEKRGLVRSTKEAAPSEEGGRERRYFRLVERGLRRLRASRRELERLWQGVESELET